MNRSLFYLLFVAFFVVLFVVMTGTALAGKDHEVFQDDIKFSVPLKVIKPGDTLTFTNKDKVVHNIVSLTSEFQFDLGKVRPGESKSLQFNAEGVVDIECTIHPGMRLTLFIFD